MKLGFRPTQLRKSSDARKAQSRQSVRHRQQMQQAQQAQQLQLDVANLQINPKNGKPVFLKGLQIGPLNSTLNLNPHNSAMNMT